MFKSNKMKVLLQELNSVPNKQNEEKKNILIECFLGELIGEVLPGVRYELVNNMKELINSSCNLRLVSYDGSIYLTDVSNLSMVYSGDTHLISNYLMLNKGVLDIASYSKRISYNTNRTNNLSSYENKRSCYIENEMFYNDEGLEYYRVQKTNSYDDSLVQFNFVCNFDRISSDSVLVSGHASIGRINGLDPYEYNQEPYTINYTGVNLDIDVSKLGYESIDRAALKNRKKGRR